MKDSFQKVSPNLGGKSSDMTNIHKEITIDNRIFLKGFKLETKEEEVENIFKAYGDIVETKIIRDTFNGQSRGFGFITFDSQQVAQEVLNKVQSIQIGDTEITVGPAKIRRLPPFGKSFRNRYIQNGVHQPNFIPPPHHHQNQAHQQAAAQYYSMPCFVSPDGMFTWLPNNGGGSPYQKLPYYPDASGGYYQQDGTMTNEHQANINGSNGDIINNTNNNKYENGVTTNEMFVNTQQQPTPNTTTSSNGKYDSQQSSNSSSNATSSRSSPITQNPSPNNGDHQFKPSQSGSTPIFNNQNLQQQQQPAFTPVKVNSPQNGGPNGGEFVPMNGSYIHHPNAAFIPTTSHMAMFNNNSSQPQYVSNSNSSTNHSDMKHQQQQNHHPTNFFYNGMVPCSSDRTMSAVPMGYPPVTCSASDMAFLAAGLNNMMTVQPSYQYIPMAGPPNMPFIPVTTAPTTMDFNNNSNKLVNVENHDAVSFTPVSPTQSAAMMHHSNAQPPQSTFQQQPSNKIPLANGGGAGKSNVVDTVSVVQPQQQQQSHAVEGGNPAGGAGNNSSVGLKAQNFVFMSTAPGKVNRVVVH